MRSNESVQLGKQLIEQALKGYGLSLDNMTPQAWDKLEQWTHHSSEEIFADVGLGRCVAAGMAKRLEVLLGEQEDDANKDPATKYSEPPPGAGAPIPVVISGAEGMSVQLSPCCRPIPGDAIMGYIGLGLGMAVHTTGCRSAHRIHKRDPERWIDIEWAPQPGRLFDVMIKILVRKTKGVFARIAADITAGDANIAHISMDEDFTQEFVVLRLVIQVANRVHLANVMRRTRINQDVMRITREKSSETQPHRRTGGMRIDRERPDY
jgi:GTP pyrophosphokinase